MEKVYVVYWSQTGNTETMANMLKSGVEAAGATAELLEASNADADTLAQASGFAIGCPAMGAEELEDSVVEPLVEALESKVAGKNLVLFGSYDWGDGQWMRDWEARMTGAGAVMVAPPVICNNTPDEEGLANCKALGEALAKA